MSVFVSVPHWFYYCASIMYFEEWNDRSPQDCSFCPGLLWLSRVFFWVNVNFSSFFFPFLFLWKMRWGFDSIALNLVSGFWLNGHLIIFYQSMNMRYFTISSVSEICHFHFRGLDPIMKQTCDNFHSSSVPGGYTNCHFMWFI